MNSNNRVLCISFYKETILYFLLFIPHLKPPFLEYYAPSLEMPINILRVISFLVIIFLYTLRGRVSKIVAMILLMQIYLFLDTFIQGGSMHTAIINTFSVVSCVLLFDYGMDEKENFFPAILLDYEIIIYFWICVAILILCYPPFPAV